MESLTRRKNVVVDNYYCDAHAVVRVAESSKPIERLVAPFGYGIDAGEHLSIISSVGIHGMCSPGM